MFLNCIETEMANTWLIEFSFLNKIRTEYIFPNEFSINDKPLVQSPLFEQDFEIDQH